jgi:hypothetical protein
MLWFSLKATVSGRSAMATKIFVNLPVKDLAMSKEFFARLGYTFNPQFTDDTAASMVISDDIYAMLITHSPRTKPPKSSSPSPATAKRTSPASTKKPSPPAPRKPSPRRITASWSCTRSTIWTGISGNICGWIRRMCRGEERFGSAKLKDSDLAFRATNAWSHSGGPGLRSFGGLTLTPPVPQSTS